MCKVSIIIPCYNSGQYLPEAISSIQAYKGMHPYEVIIVDDGSTDAVTKYYLHTCSQLRNYRVIHQPNAGPAAARNTGVAQAAADYILFLDSDNTLQADAFINGGIAVLDANPSVGVFYGKPSFFGDVTKERIFTTGPFILEKLWAENYIDMCSMVRKTAWQQVGGLDGNRLLMGHEDWDFWIRIGRTDWQFHYEEAVLFNYRVVPHSMVTQSTGSANYERMVCYIYQKHYDVLPQHLKEWCAGVALSQQINSMQSPALQVSVIVPSYNHAAYLPQRLHSILNQTYPHLELIILDDASPDNSRAVIEPYRTHPRVAHIVYNEVNSGTTFKQWERGIQLASGSLIWIAESDDWCEPHFLETIVKGIAENPACVLGYAQSYTVNDAGDILDRTVHNKLAEHLDGKTFICQHLAEVNTISNASMAVFTKAAYQAVSKDYLTYHFGGDWLFWTEIARQGEVFISGRLLNYFRKHGQDVSGEAYASGLNYIEDLRVWEALVKNGLIKEDLYKGILSRKYAKFIEARPWLATTVVEQIEQGFEKSGHLKAF